MRRRIRQDILITKPPPPEKKRVYKYKDNLYPFNIWFRERISEYGGLKKFCFDSKIDYTTARCWTYKTAPQIYYRYQISRYFGSKFGVPYLQILADIDNLRQKRGSVNV